jgi:hypothetical protein
VFLEQYCVLIRVFEYRYRHPSVFEYRYRCMQNDGQNDTPARLGATMSKMGVVQREHMEMSTGSDGANSCADT